MKKTERTVIDMKKISALVLTLIIAFSVSVAVCAATPTEGKIVNKVGSPGVEIEDASSSGIRVNFIKDSGATWASRCSYTDSLDISNGLYIRLENLVMPDDDTAFAFMINNSVGQWVDTAGMLFLNFNTHYTIEAPKLKNLEYGLIQIRSGNYKVNYKTTELLSGTMEIYVYKKDANTWIYNLNGIELEFDNATFAAKVPNPKMCNLGFGCWGNNADVSYTIAEISTGKKPTKTSAPVATIKGEGDAAPTINATESSADTVSDTTEVIEDNSAALKEDAASGKDENGSETEKLILIIVCCVAGLVFIGMILLFVIILKKPASASNGKKANSGGQE